MFDLGETEGAHFITMEYVRGEDLRSSIKRFGQLPLGKSISIAKQICEGLSEAHRLGVVHRDMKSNNIMIDKEGNVRIMDFGIARSLEAKGITGAGVMIGTPEYMSPEQVDGKEVDQRSDIYSLGVILYEMVTGRVPFEGDTPFTIGMKHKGETPENPKKLNTQISDDLNRLILRCLEKEKDKRYQSAGEVRSELANIEKGIPTTERIVPERKPLTSREITVQFSVKKTLIPVLVIIAIVIIGLILWQVLPKQKAAPLDPSGKPSLAVMYFENNTGDQGLDHYRKAISDLLITDLSQSKYIKTLSGAELYAILRELNLLEEKSYSSEDLKEIAARGGVEHILLGNYTKAGENFRVSIMLHDAKTAELISSERVEGIGESSIFSMVDELTRRIKANFRLSEEQIANDIDMEIGRITTNSPEAYKYYSEGRTHHLAVNYIESIALMEKAIEIDPEFAMAYRSLASAHGNRGEFAERDKYIKKAFEFSKRLSDRERLIIEGNFYYYNSKTYGKALESLNQLMQLYPDDREGRLHLAFCYLQIEDWDKAIELLNIARQQGEKSANAFYNLASSYRHIREYEKAKEVLEYYLTNISENRAIRRFLSTVHVYQGNFDLALNELNKTFSLFQISSGNVSRGNIFLIKGDLTEAKNEYQKLLGREEARINAGGIGGLFQLYLLQGRLEDAKVQIMRGIELSKKEGQIIWETFYRNLMGYLHYGSKNYEMALKEFDQEWTTLAEQEDLEGQIFNLYCRGMIYLEMNELNKSERTAEQVEELTKQTINKRIAQYHHHLLGMIELKRKNYDMAIDLFKKAISLDNNESTALLIEPLALAYDLSGDLDAARIEYERITKLTFGRLWYGDIFAKSIYALGKIHEQQGDTSKAIEHCKKFLSLWKDADPGIAEVEDAKKRLAGLEGN
jgi:serine/threonine protein kinase/tetratricopeptide (TPR) repeat protein